MMGGVLVLNPARETTSAGRHDSTVRCGNVPPSGAFGQGVEGCAGPLDGATGAERRLARGGHGRSDHPASGPRAARQPRLPPPPARSRADASRIQGGHSADGVRDLVIGRQQRARANRHLFPPAGRPQPPPSPGRQRPGGAPHVGPAPPSRPGRGRRAGYRRGPLRATPGARPCRRGPVDRADAGRPPRRRRPPTPGRPAPRSRAEPPRRPADRRAAPARSTPGGQGFRVSRRRWPRLAARPRSSTARRRRSPARRATSSRAARCAVAGAWLATRPRWASPAARSAATSAAAQRRAS